VPLAQIRQTPDGRTIVDMPPGKARLSLLALLGLALFAAVAAVAIPSIVIRILLALAALFFAAMFLAALPNLFRRGNVRVLTITYDGVETPRTGLIPWSEIAEIRHVTVVGQRAVGIWTIDPYSSARHGPWYFWPFALFNRATHEPALSFTERAVPVDELLAELGRYWQSSDPGVVEASFGPPRSADGSRRGTRTTT
jgi:hypothetical protein